MQTTKQNEMWLKWCARQYVYIDGNRSMKLSNVVLISDCVTCDYTIILLNTSMAVIIGKNVEMNWQDLETY